MPINLDRDTHLIARVFCPLLPELDRYLRIRLAEDAAGTLVISFHLAARDPWT